jgi:ferredoxin-NADP reductase
MNDILARYRDVLVARLGLIEEEIRLAEARYKAREGDFHFVTLGNVAVIERQLKAVHAVRVQFQRMDIEEFETTEQFKQFALAKLQRLYDSRIILRSAIRIVMECVRNLE